MTKLSSKRPGCGTAQKPDYLTIRFPGEWGPQTYEQGGRHGTYMHSLGCVFEGCFKFGV